jgi:hypothetical protein
MLCRERERDGVSEFHETMEKRSEGGVGTHRHRSQIPLLASRHQHLPLLTHPRPLPYHSLNLIFFHVIKNRALIMWLQVYGPSMLPTLNLTGDVLLAEHLSPRLGKVGSGDVVLVRSPVDPRKMLTKRVVGMEGDRVTFFVDPLHTDRCQSAVV